MNTVWLLFNEMDYESAAVHSVYNEKPSVETLARLLRDSFGWSYGDRDTESARHALTLHENNRVRILDNYTWDLDERAVV